MLFSVEQAFVGRDEKRAPLKMPAWEAISTPKEQKRGDLRKNLEIYRANVVICLWQADQLFG